MTNEAKPFHYHIYLLTVWMEQGRDHEASRMWRFRLKDPCSGQQRAFANLTELVIALHAELIENELIEIEESALIKAGKNQKS